MTHKIQLIILRLAIIAIIIVAIVFGLSSCSIQKSAMCPMIKKSDNTAFTHKHYSF